MGLERAGKAVLRPIVPASLRNLKGSEHLGPGAELEHPLGRSMKGTASEL